MGGFQFKKFLYLFLFLVGFTLGSPAQESIQESQALVAVRMIGHRLLLQSGDSLSRVLPVEKVNGRYLLRFESEFEFTPDALVKTIDSIILESGMAENYLVEVQGCNNQEVVYSYEVRIPGRSDIVPCSNRMQPKGCYQLFFTVIEEKNTPILIEGQEQNLNENSFGQAVNRLWFLSILPLAAMLFFAGKYYKRGKNASPCIENFDSIAIGASRFDMKNSFVSVNNKKIELTGKEAELLTLLNNSANTTIDRDAILHAVWGDEGDYTGRTLDVFISKLRKKLEADNSIRIVNIRGIGYKLIIN